MCIRDRLKPFQEKIAKDDDKTKSKRASILQAAGYYNPSAQTIFYASRLSIAISLATVTATYFFISASKYPPGILVLLVTLAGAVGYFLPLLYVSQRIKERKLKFRQGLPDAMDMILICLESGLSFPASLKHVTHELSDVHPVVSEHFEIVTLEFQAGRKRADALRNLAERVDIQEVRSLTTMIIQSDELGTSLTRALRAASDDMRRDRMLKAEEKASALPVKKSIPLGLCLFPALYGPIMVPVLVKISKVL